MFNIRIAFLKIEMHQRGGAGAISWKGKYYNGKNDHVSDGYPSDSYDNSGCLCEYDGIQVNIP